MAQNEATSPHVQTLTVPEAQALADRLFSRSQSTLFVASPEVRRDLCMASRAIRSMLHVIDRLALVRLESPGNSFMVEEGNDVAEIQKDRVNRTHNRIV